MAPQGPEAPPPQPLLGAQPTPQLPTFPRGMVPAVGHHFRVQCLTSSDEHSANYIIFGQHTFYWGVNSARITLHYSFQMKGLWLKRSAFQEYLLHSESRRNDKKGRTPEYCHPKIGALDSQHHNMRYSCMDCLLRMYRHRCQFSAMHGSQSGKTTFEIESKLDAFMYSSIYIYI